MADQRLLAIGVLVCLGGPLAPVTLMADSGMMLENSGIDSALLVSEKELSNERGRYKPAVAQVSTQDVEAVLDNNTTLNTSNGDNTVANQAFTNAQGHLSVIQNSGNNVIIQDTTIYNITFID